MTTKDKQKDPGPFTPTFDVVLSMHWEMSPAERPVYVFRAATIKERHQERIFNDRIENIGDEDPETVSVDQLVMDLIPLVSARLVDVKIGGESKPGEMDLESRLDVSSIIELFRCSIIHELPSIAQKKRSLLQSSLSMDGFADPAKDAPEDRTQETASPKSNARNATAKDARDAEKPDGLK